MTLTVRSRRVPPGAKSALAGMGIVERMVETNPMERRERRVADCSWSGNSLSVRGGWGSEDVGLL